MTDWEWGVDRVCWRIRLVFKKLIYVDAVR